MTYSIYKLVLSIGFVMISLFGAGQQEIVIPLTWNESPGIMTIGSKNYSYPHLENSFVSEREFLFLKEFERNNKSSQWEFDLLSYQTSSIDQDRKSTRLNSSHVRISYAVFCLKKKTQKT